MKTQTSNVQKKQYVAPKLTTHGDIAAVTQQQVKSFGIGDGFLLNIPGVGDVPIKNYS